MEDIKAALPALASASNPADVEAALAALTDVASTARGLKLVSHKDTRRKVTAFVASSISRIPASSVSLALRLLWRMADASRVISRAIYGEVGPKPLVGVLRRAGSSTEACAVACELLLLMSRHSKKFALTMRLDGGVDAFCALLAGNPDHTLLRPACRMLQKCCDGNENNVRIAHKRGAVKSVLASLRARQGSTAVCSALMGVLAALCDGSKFRLPLEAADPDALALIVATLRRHVEDEQVAVGGLTLLQALAADAETAARLCAAGAFMGAWSAVVRHIATPAVGRLAMATIWRLVSVVQAQASGAGGAATGGAGVSAAGAAAAGAAAAGGGTATPLAAVASALAAAGGRAGSAGAASAASALAAGASASTLVSAYSALAPAAAAAAAAAGPRAGLGAAAPLAATPPSPLPSNFYAAGWRMAAPGVVLTIVKPPSRAAAVASALASATVEAISTLLTRSGGGGGGGPPATLTHWPLPHRYLHSLPVPGAAAATAALHAALPRWAGIYLPRPGYHPPLPAAPVAFRIAYAVPKPRPPRKSLAGGSPHRRRTGTLGGAGAASGDGGIGGGDAVGAAGAGGGSGHHRRGRMASHFDVTSASGGNSSNSSGGGASALSPVHHAGPSGAGGVITLVSGVTRKRLASRAAAAAAAEAAAAAATAAREAALAAGSSDEAAEAAAAAAQAAAAEAAAEIAAVAAADGAGDDDGDEDGGVAATLVTDGVAGSGADERMGGDGTGDGYDDADDGGEEEDDEDDGEEDEEVDDDDPADAIAFFGVRAALPVALLLGTARGRADDGGVDADCAASAAVPRGSATESAATTAGPSAGDCGGAAGHRRSGTSAALSAAGGAAASAMPPAEPDLDAADDAALFFRPSPRPSLALATSDAGMGAELAATGTGLFADATNTCGTGSAGSQVVATGPGPVAAGSAAPAAVNQALAASSASSSASAAGGTGIVYGGYLAFPTQPLQTTIHNVQLVLQPAGMMGGGPSSGRSASQLRSVATMLTAPGGAGGTAASSGGSPLSSYGTPLSIGSGATSGIAATSTPVLSRLPTHHHALSHGGRSVNPKVGTVSLEAGAMGMPVSFVQRAASTGDGGTAAAGTLPGTASMVGFAPFGGTPVSPVTTVGSMLGREGGGSGLSAGSTLASAGITSGGITVTTAAPGAAAAGSGSSPTNVAAAATAAGGSLRRSATVAAASSGSSGRGGSSSGTGGSLSSRALDTGSMETPAAVGGSARGLSPMRRLQPSSTGTGTGAAAVATLPSTPPSVGTHSLASPAHATPQSPVLGGASGGGTFRPPPFTQSRSLQDLATATAPATGTSGVTLPLLVDPSAASSLVKQTSRARYGSAGTVSAVSAASSASGTAANQLARSQSGGLGSSSALTGGTSATASGTTLPPLRQASNGSGGTVSVPPLSSVTTANSDDCDLAAGTASVAGTAAAATTTRTFASGSMDDEAAAPCQLQLRSPGRRRLTSSAGTTIGTATSRSQGGGDRSPLFRPSPASGSGAPADVPAGLAAGSGSDAISMAAPVSGTGSGSHRRMSSAASTGSATTAATAGGALVLPPAAGAAGSIAEARAVAAGTPPAVAASPSPSSATAVCGGGMLGGSRMSRVHADIAAARLQTAAGSGSTAGGEAAATTDGTALVPTPPAGPPPPPPVAASSSGSGGGGRRRTSVSGSMGSLDPAAIAAAASGSASSGFTVAAGATTLAAATTAAASDGGGGSMPVHSSTGGGGSGGSASLGERPAVRRVAFESARGWMAMPHWFPELQSASAFLWDLAPLRALVWRATQLQLQQQQQQALAAAASDDRMSTPLPAFAGVSAVPDSATNAAISESMAAALAQLSDPTQGTEVEASTPQAGVPGVIGGRVGADAGGLMGASNSSISTGKVPSLMGVVPRASPAGHQAARASSTAAGAAGALAPPKGSGATLASGGASPSDGTGVGFPDASAAGALASASTPEAVAAAAALEALPKAKAFPGRRVNVVAAAADGVPSAEAAARRALADVHVTGISLAFVRMLLAAPGLSLDETRCLDRRLPATLVPADALTGFGTGDSASSAGAAAPTSLCGAAVDAVKAVLRDAVIAGTCGAATSDVAVGDAGATATSSDGADASTTTTDSSTTTAGLPAGVSVRAARVHVSPSGMVSLRPFVLPPFAVPAGFHCSPPMGRIVGLPPRPDPAAVLQALAPVPPLLTGTPVAPVGSAAMVRASAPPTSTALGRSSLSLTPASAGLTGGYAVLLHPPPPPALVHSPAGTPTGSTTPSGGSFSFASPPPPLLTATGRLTDLPEPMLVVPSEQRAALISRMLLQTIARAGVAAGQLMRHRFLEAATPAATGSHRAASAGSASTASSSSLDLHAAPGFEAEPGTSDESAAGVAEAAALAPLLLRCQNTPIYHRHEDLLRLQASTAVVTLTAGGAAPATTGTSASMPAASINSLAIIIAPAASTPTAAAASGGRRSVPPPIPTSPHAAHGRHAVAALLAPRPKSTYAIVTRFPYVASEALAGAIPLPTHDLGAVVAIEHGDASSSSGAGALRAAAAAAASGVATKGVGKTSGGTNGLASAASGYSLGRGTNTAPLPWALRPTDIAAVFDHLTPEAAAVQALPPCDPLEEAGGGDGGDDDSQGSDEDVDTGADGGAADTSLDGGEGGPPDADADDDDAPEGDDEDGGLPGAPGEDAGSSADPSRAPSPSVAAGGAGISGGALVVKAPTRKSSAPSALSPTARRGAAGGAGAAVGASMTSPAIQAALTRAARIHQAVLRNGALPTAFAKRDIMRMLGDAADDVQAMVLARHGSKHDGAVAGSSAAAAAAFASPAGHHAGARPGSVAGGRGTTPSSSGRSWSARRSALSETAGSPRHTTSGHASAHTHALPSASSDALLSRVLAASVGNLTPKVDLLARIPPLEFESRFETGNLCAANRVGPLEYELTLDPDINTGGHTQWFFFRVRNMVAEDGTITSVVTSSSSSSAATSGGGGGVRTKTRSILPVPGEAVGWCAPGAATPAGGGHRPASTLASSAAVTPVKGGAAAGGGGPSSAPASSSSSPVAPTTAAGGASGAPVAPAAAAAAAGSPFVYRFHVVNLEKGGSSFNDGMRPLAYYQTSCPQPASTMAATAAASSFGSASSVWEALHLSGSDSSGIPSPATSSPTKGQQPPPVTVSTYVPPAGGAQAGYLPTLPGEGWRRCGFDIVYYRNQYSRLKTKQAPPVHFEPGDADDASGAGANPQQPTTSRAGGGAAASMTTCPQYSETWNITFPPGVHTVFFAYCYPYTYTDIRRDVVRWERRALRAAPMPAPLARSLLTATAATPAAHDGSVAMIAAEFRDIVDTPAFVAALATAAGGGVVSAPAGHALVRSSTAAPPDRVCIKEFDVLAAVGAVDGLEVDALVPLPPSARGSPASPTAAATPVLSRPTHRGYHGSPADAAAASSQLPPAALPPAWLRAGVPFRPRVGLSLSPSLPIGTLFSSGCLHRTLLCHSISGNPLPLLTITEFSDGPLAVACRPYIVLSGRVHPGETNGSWMLRGAVDFLTSSAPIAVALRKRVIFKVIPVLNPDGVINGHHRTNVAGLDLNRHWTTPDQARAPTIWHLRTMLMMLQHRAAAMAVLNEAAENGAPLAMEDLAYHDTAPYVQQLLATAAHSPPTPAEARAAPATPATSHADRVSATPSSSDASQPAAAAASSSRGGGVQTMNPVPETLRVLPPVPQPVLLYCDFHGHSRRQDVFTFGCYELSHDGAPFIPGDLPADPIPVNPGSRLFSRLLANRVDTFTYKGCGWKVAKEKMNCARVAMWRDAGLTASYTIEATFGGASAGYRQGVHLNTAHYEEVGHAFCVALHDWLDGPQAPRVAASLEALRRVAHAQVLTAAVRKQRAAAAAGPGAGAASASSAPSGSAKDSFVIDYGGGRTTSVALTATNPDVAAAIDAATGDGARRPKTVAAPPARLLNRLQGRTGSGSSGGAAAGAGAASSRKL